MAGPGTTLDGRATRSSRTKPIAVLRCVYRPETPRLQLETRRLAPGRHRAGRGVDPDEGIALDDHRASRLHASFIVASRSHRMRVADEDSRHGTFVNGQPVDEAWLSDGDRVRLGDSFFVVRYLPPDHEDAEIETIVGRAPSTCALRRDILQVATHDIDVLIQGESGTGKELVASAIHTASGRSGAFVPVNCAAIVDTLAESQLFGHRAGAFSGAVDDQEGFFRAADGGTLFLDEVGDLPPALQPKLLRALEQREVLPIGESIAQPVDVRVVAATHRDLDEAVSNGDFRGDLMSRLDQFRLTLSPLQHRPEDIAELIAHFLGGDADRLEPDLFEAIWRHAWPYNVRSLRAALRELAVRGAREKRWSPSLLAHRLTSPGLAAMPTRPSSTDQGTSTPSTSRTTPSRDELVALVEKHRGNVQAVSREVGRSRMQVYRWLEQYDIDLAEYRDL